jgi:hypothetical protein
MKRNMPNGAGLLVAKAKLLIRKNVTTSHNEVVLTFWTRKGAFLR